MLAYIVAIKQLFCNGFFSLHSFLQWLFLQGRGAPGWALSKLQFPPLKKNWKFSDSPAIFGTPENLPYLTPSLYAPGFLFNKVLKDF